MSKKNYWKKKILGPYLNKEIHSHGLKWSPSDSSLPMSLFVPRPTSILVGIFFLPFCFLFAFFALTPLSIPSIAKYRTKNNIAATIM